MGSIQKIIGYIVFTAIMVVVFLYMLFPKDPLRAYIQTQIQRNLPDVSVEIGQVSPAFPPGLNLIDILCERDELPLVSASRATIRPALLHILGSEKVVNFAVDTSEGHIDGQGIVQTGKQGELSVKADIDKIALQEIAGLRALSDYEISGLLSGQVNFKTLPGRSGNGNADLVVTEAKLDLTNPLFGIEALSFTSIEAQLNLSTRRLQLRRCNLRGNEVDGSISGSVMLRTPMNQSRLNLSGVLQPHAEFMATLQRTIPVALLGGNNLGQKGLPFRITGTFEKPGFSLR
jgi:type II secretion system protein N